MANNHTKYPSLERQWRKLMCSLYTYKSMRVKNVTSEDWRIRHMIWDFKDGRNHLNVAYIVANKIIQLFGDKAQNMILACVPASSAESNEIRYKHFSHMVCQLTGMTNAYEHIYVEGKKDSLHNYSHGSKSTNSEKVSFDDTFFQNKKVLVFDDVLTKGFSYAIFANNIEKHGAEVVGGLFIGKTYNC